MFSIVMPMDLDRLDQFANTKQAYDEMPYRKQFIVPTRSKELFDILQERGLTKNLFTVTYKTEKGFNCSKALNIGVRHAQFENIIITSPEVKPAPDVLDKLSECLDKNIVCQVHDQDEEGSLKILVCSTFRSESPAMYFLAMFKKSDILKINGWDEEFMKGYAYEDNDFGARWVRAGLPFEFRDDIQATHQYHARGETIPGGTGTNYLTYSDNNEKGVVYCANGIEKSPVL